MAKKATRSSIVFDYKYLGKEPAAPTREPGLVELINLYNWYNHFHNTEDAKKFIADYCTANNINEIDVSKHTTNTFGWMARMLTRGGVFSTSDMNKFNKYIGSLHGIPSQMEAEPVKAPSKVVNITDQYFADLDDMCDNLSSGVYAYLQDKSVGPNYAKQLREHYNLVANEIYDAYGKHDNDIVEAYSCYSRKQLKELVNYYKQMMADFDKYIEGVKEAKTKTPRKPRKPRARNMNTVMKHFKYMESFPEMKLSSDKAIDIIGAQSVVLFNTAYNIITLIVAEEGKTLDIHRSAIINHDPTLSSSKRIGRKTEENINNVMGATKRSRAKTFNSIKGNAHFTNRVNEKTIILKIDR